MGKSAQSKRWTPNLFLRSSITKRMNERTVMTWDARRLLRSKHSLHLMTSSMQQGNNIMTVKTQTALTKMKISLLLERSACGTTRSIINTFSNITWGCTQTTCGCCSLTIRSGLAHPVIMFPRDNNLKDLNLLVLNLNQFSAKSSEEMCSLQHVLSLFLCSQSRLTPYIDALCDEWTWNWFPVPGFVWFSDIYTHRVNMNWPI